MRRHFGREAWERAVEFAREDDGGPLVATRGVWTARKLFFLCNYLEQFVRGMSGNVAFPGGLNYIDLFAGSGVSAVETDHGLARYPGSTMIAASLESKPFQRMLIADASETSLDWSMRRIRRVGYLGEVRHFLGDVNATIGEIVRSIPPRSLSVAFVDPYSLDIAYDTIATLARQRPVDLVVLFSDRIDLARNVQSNYYPNPDSKLDQFLGKESAWRRSYDALTDQSGPPLRQMFADLYCEQLKSLGYGHTKSWILEGEQGPMFRLVYASKNALGLKYCGIAMTEDFDRQRNLPGLGG